MTIKTTHQVIGVIELADQFSPEVESPRSPWTLLAEKASEPTTDRLAASEPEVPTLELEADLRQLVAELDAELRKLQAMMADESR